MAPTPMLDLPAMQFNKELNCLQYAGSPFFHGVKGFDIGSGLFSRAKYPAWVHGGAVVQPAEPDDTILHTVSPLAQWVYPTRKASAQAGSPPTLEPDHPTWEQLGIVSVEAARALVPPCPQ